MHIIIGIIVVFIIVFLALGLILWTLGFVLRYLTLPLVVFLIALLIREFVSKKNKKDSDLIIVCVIFIPILCFGFWGGGKLLSWLDSSDNKDEAKNATTVEAKSESNSESKSKVKDEVKEKAKSDSIAQTQAKEKAEADAIAESQAKEKAELEAKVNQKWTKDNIVSLIKESNLLSSQMSFYDNEDGTKVYPHDNSSYGKTNIPNAYCLELTLDLNESQIKNKELMKETAFMVAKVIKDNSSRINFNLNLVVIHFANFKENQYGENHNNFYIGINTIKNYFSKSRSDKTSISTITGEVKKVDFDYESFYNWIEDNFTLPEDNSILTENNSWTTLSSKANIE